MGEAAISQIRRKLLITGIQACRFIAGFTETLSRLFRNCVQLRRTKRRASAIRFAHSSARIEPAKLPNRSFRASARAPRDERKMNLSSIGSPGPPRMQLDRNRGFTSWGKGNSITPELNNLSTDVVEREGTFGNNFLFSRGTSADQPKIDRPHLVTLAASARFSR